MDNRGGLVLKILGILLVAAFVIIGASGGMGAAKPVSVEPTQTPETVEPTPTPTPEPQPEYFNLSFIGDCTLAATTAKKQTSVSIESVVGDNYAYPFELTRDHFIGDDMTMANFECVLGDSSLRAEDKNFTFLADSEYVNILTDGSVDFVTLGNNHVLDYGEEGYASTKAVLEAAGVGYVGRDETTIYTTPSGLKIGVYAASFGQKDALVAGISSLKAQGAEFIIAALHWGDEGSYRTNNIQTTQAHAAIDAGANLVYGSHPHTLQPMEEYNGGLIFYSMGNWIFGGNTAPRDVDTIILKLSVKRDVDGTISIDSRQIIPCACSGTGSGANNYQPVAYEAGTEEYERTMSKIEGTFKGADLTVSYEYNFNEY